MACSCASHGCHSSCLVIMLLLLSQSAEGALISSAERAELCCNGLPSRGSRGTSTVAILVNCGMKSMCTDEKQLVRELVVAPDCRFRVVPCDPPCSSASCLAVCLVECGVQMRVIHAVEQKTQELGGDVEAALEFWEDILTKEFQGSLSKLREALGGHKGSEDDTGKFKKRCRELLQKGLQRMQHDDPDTAELAESGLASGVPNSSEQGKGEGVLERGGEKEFASPGMLRGHASEDTEGGREAEEHVCEESEVVRVGEGLIEVGSDQRAAESATIDAQGDLGNAAEEPISDGKMHIPCTITVGSIRTSNVHTEEQQECEGTVLAYPQSTVRDSLAIVTGSACAIQTDDCT